MVVLPSKPCMDIIIYMYVHMCSTFAACTLYIHDSCDSDVKLNMVCFMTVHVCYTLVIEGA